MDSLQRMLGIQDVIRQAMDLGQPVFTGEEAFMTCITGLQAIPCYTHPSSRIHWEGIDIILCKGLHTMNFFTCPLRDFDYDWYTENETRH